MADMIQTEPTERCFACYVHGGDCQAHLVKRIEELERLVKALTEKR